MPSEWIDLEALKVADTGATIPIEGVFLEEEDEDPLEWLSNVLYRTCVNKYSYTFTCLVWNKPILDIRLGISFAKLLWNIRLVHSAIQQY